MEKLVSIVLPVYNGAKYLRESIDSVLAQSYENWELLILDDCSTDESPAIAKEYAARDSRVHYHRNEHNLRLPGNLNRGFSLARGEYLTWTSDDNRYRPTALEKMVQTLEGSKDAQFVFASCRIIDGAGKEVEYIMVREDSGDKIVGSNPVGACFLYTRAVYETVGEYDPELVLVEDIDYWQRIAARFPVATISEILYDYRWHDGALTSTMRREQFLRNLETMLLKNRPAFGRLSSLRKYYYYKGLYDIRQELGEENPYAGAYKRWSLWFLLARRVPAALKRRIMALLGSLIRGSIARKQNKRLQNQDFTILCHNCIGGAMYQRLGTPFLSPTINLWIEPVDFLKMLFDLDFYLKQELAFVDAPESYPVAMLHDVKIHFTHASNREEAQAAWSRGCKRINRDNLFVILYDTRGVSKEDILRLRTFPCKNKVVFSEQSYPDIDYVATVPTNSKPNGKYYLDQDAFGIHTFEKCFDYVAWLNGQSKMERLLRTKGDGRKP